MSPPRHFHVIKKLPIGDQQINCHITTQAWTKIKMLATKHQCSMSEVFRQMIQFCLSDYDGKEGP